MIDNRAKCDVALVPSAGFKVLVKGQADSGDGKSDAKSLVIKAGQKYLVQFGNGAKASPGTVKLQPSGDYSNDVMVLTFSAVNEGEMTVKYPLNGGNKLCVAVNPDAWLKGTSTSKVGFLVIDAKAALRGSGGSKSGSSSSEAASSDEETPAKDPGNGD
jgi:hypothetical protein